jgi:hypothetical protein
MMEEAPENGKESSHSVYANGMNEGMNECRSYEICFAPPDSHLVSK